MTGFPSRRAIVAGIATAPIAGFPAVAPSIAACPTLAAVRAYQRLTEIERAAWAAVDDSAEAYAQASAAQGEANQALVALFETSPTSRAGALALLRIAAEQIDEAYEAGLFDDLQERFAPAMQEAIAVLAAEGDAA